MIFLRPLPFCAEPDGAALPEQPASAEAPARPAPARPMRMKLRRVQDAASAREASSRLFLAFMRNSYSPWPRSKRSQGIAMRRNASTTHMSTRLRAEMRKMTANILSNEYALRTRVI